LRAFSFSRRRLKSIGGKSSQKGYGKPSCSCRQGIDPDLIHLVRTSLGLPGEGEGIAAAA